MIDQTTIDLATDHARICSKQPDPRVSLINFGWAMLHLLYIDLVKEKEITPINELPEDQKLSIWREVCSVIPDRSPLRKLWTAQALYMYELLTNVQDQE